MDLKYPCYRYKADGSVKRVESPEDEAKLGKGWQSSPFPDPDDPVQMGTVAQVLTPEAIAASTPPEVYPAFRFHPDVDGKPVAPKKVASIEEDAALLYPWRSRPYAEGEVAPVQAVAPDIDDDPEPESESEPVAVAAKQSKGSKK